MRASKQRWALVVVCTGSLVVGLDNLILNVALPTLARELHASTSQLQWIVDAYILVFAGLLLVGGSLGDRFGRAKVLRIGLIVFVLASVVAAFSSEAVQLAACRAAMGVGGALILPTSVAIITNVFTDPTERGRALGTWSAIGGLGVALGPVLGGVLLSQFWWGSVFLVNVPIVLTALVVGWWAIPDSRNPASSRADPIGVLLSVASVSTLVWAAIEAPTNGWASLETLASFVVAAGLLAGFVGWELRCPHAMLQLRSFRNPRFSVGVVAGSVASCAFGGVLFMLTQLLQLVYGYSPMTAGLALIPLAVAFISGGMLGPRLSERLGTKRAIAVGLGIYAVGFVVLATANVQSGYAVIVVASVAIGAGCGLPHAPATDAVVGAVAREQAGVASGTLATGRQVGTALGVAVMGSLLVSGYRSSLAGRTRSLDLSRAELASARSSLSAALSTAQRLGGPVGQALRESADVAFVHGMRIGLAVGATVLTITALLVLRYLPARAREVRITDDGAALAALDVVID